ncbi:MAG: DUF2339 domain-containing protein [Sedimentisphaerales bacterium]
MHNEEFVIAIFVFVLVIGLLLSGLIGLIISIIALKRINRLEEQIKYSQPQPPPLPIEEPLPVPQESMPPLPIEPPQKMPGVEEEQPLATFESFKTIWQKEDKAKSASLEQQIGTKWVLILGIITVIVGTVFFLKYAYDNNWIGPLGRVAIVTVSGLLALFAGEMTRKRGYGIVAKAVTSLGFAMLYAAVFSAYRFYGLIKSPPAFILAILVTLAAMLYAVSLNEILIAILSLVGGFLTPIIVSTGENLPMPLFTYVLILGIGAMLCAYYRKWRAVDLLAFAGTFVLYTGWFEKFFRPKLAAVNKTPEQITIALGWLGIFFVIYMVLPLFNDLVKKMKAQREDVALVLLNAVVTFYYLWTILYTRYRTELAFCTIGLCIAHLVMVSVVARRCKEDFNLRLILLAVGLFFLTIAIPLYLKMYAIAMAWAAEAAVLTIIGLRYRSILTLASAGVAFILSLFQLLAKMPMHKAAFVLVWNPAFGTWLFVVIAAVLCHIFYRRNKWVIEYYRNIISQVIYSAACLLLMLMLSMEWFYHCKYNMADRNIGQTFFINGLMLLFTLFTLSLVARPICPAGLFCKIFAVAAGIAGSIFVVFAFTSVYFDKFIIFANINFAFAVLFAAGLFASALFLKRTVGEDENDFVFPYIFSITAIFVLFILISEEIYLYWYCRNRYSEEVIVNWKFLANMYMSIAWAIYAAVLMVAGFWRKKALLRYISLGLFGILLFKVFILDMSTVKSVYRIAAFLATGITLVGVSYLYQYLKKKGFFDAVLNEKRLGD